MKPINKELVLEIHAALDKGLTKGLGIPVEGEMCVEALICHKLGLLHSDSPPCVGGQVRLAKITLNDCEWSSNKARAEGMRKLAIAQLGSDKLNQDEFEACLKLESTKRILPFLIQKHFDEVKDSRLLEYKKRFEALEELDDKLWKEFYNNYNNYYYYNNNYYYYYYHYYYYNNYYYDNYYYGDEFLLLIADVILQSLIKLDSEGCKYLKS